MGGKTSNESKAKYNAKVYDRINIAVPKGRKAELQAIADRHGQSVNGFINSLIETALQQSATERVQSVGDGSPAGTGTNASVPATSPDDTRAGSSGISAADSDVNNSSRIISQSSPDSQTVPSTDSSTLDKDRLYLPIPIWEDDSTPELERTIIAVLQKKGIALPTVGQYEAMPKEQQDRERARLFEAREWARQVLDEYERKRR